MKYILVFSVCFLFITCSVNKKEAISYGEIVKRVFNKDEIKDLQLMHKFFDTKICKDKSDNIILCYKQFFHKMKKAGSSGDIKIDISFKDQKKMYERISDSTFNEIWNLGYSWNSKLPSDTLKYIDFNIEGKYSKFLSSLRKENRVIEKYYDSYLSIGGMSPGMFGSLIMEGELYNVNNPDIRLFIAIHFLTVNDQLKRKEKL